MFGCLPRKKFKKTVQINANVLTAIIMLIKFYFIVLFLFYFCHELHLKSLIQSSSGGYIERTAEHV